jgi:hypothetical protein
LGALGFADAVEFILRPDEQTPIGDCDAASATGCVAVWLCAIAHFIQT